MKEVPIFSVSTKWPRFSCQKSEHATLIQLTRFLSEHRVLSRMFNSTIRDRKEHVNRYNRIMRSCVFCNTVINKQFHYFGSVCYKRDPDKSRAALLVPGYKRHLLVQFCFECGDPSISQRDTENINICLSIYFSMAL
jgi:hypothetical protein